MDQTWIKPYRLNQSYISIIYLKKEYWLNFDSKMITKYVFLRLIFVSNVDFIAYETDKVWIGSNDQNVRWSTLSFVGGWLD